jgi:8-oxo-dGTP pyrophosphatase MutT (NUDIX family)
MICFESNMQLAPMLHPRTGELMPAATPAATMVLMRDEVGGAPPNILMVERAASMAFAAGAAVFPGGKVDQADLEFAEQLSNDLDAYDAAARIAAIREMLEEAGLAVAIKGQLGYDRVAKARQMLHNEKAKMSDICRIFDWVPDLHALTPWARWRPPGHSTRIFDTRFYLADGNAVKKDGWADEGESVSLFWDDAANIIKRADSDELSVIFPTKRNLDRLALWNSFAEAKAHAENFPVEVVLTYAEERDGVKFLCIPEGHGYPVTSEPYGLAKRG